MLFYSIDDPFLHHHAAICAPTSRDAALLQQRQPTAVLEIGTPYGPNHIKTKHGSLQGDTWTGDIFLEGYQPYIDLWRSDCESISLAASLRLPDFFHPERLLDVSTSTYADDAAHTSAVPKETPVHCC